MAIVYAVQNQQRWDHDSNQLVSKFDLAPAERYGRIKYLLSPTAAPWNPQSIVGELTEKLADYTAADHLLLIGNPIIIGWAVAIAADAAGGNVSCLQWSGRDRKYIAVVANLFPNDQ